LDAPVAQILPPLIARLSLIVLLVMVPALRSRRHGRPPVVLFSLIVLLEMVPDVTVIRHDKKIDLRVTPWKRGCAHDVGSI
jgi:hypothetical protein